MQWWLLLAFWDFGFAASVEQCGHLLWHGVVYNGFLDTH